MPVRRALLAILAIAAVAALLPFAASAAASYKTKIVVSIKFPAFHGKIESPRHGCLGSRKVKLYSQKSGPDKLLGTGKSEDNGKWSILIGKKKVAPGTYYATVAARGKCASAKSGVVPVA